MDLLRKYMLSTAFLCAPDGDGAVADPPAADPPDPEVIAGDPPADPPAADPPEDKPHGNKGKTPWYLDRISTETAARQQAERERDEALALTSRLQRGAAPDPAAPPAAAPPAQDIDTLVNQRAQQMRLHEDSSAIRTEGIREFGASFSDTLSVLNAVGAVSDDIVLDLVAVDKANSHKILTTLAQDPEKAASFAKLDPRRRIAELTRMSDALKTPAAPAAAAAPAAPATPPKTVSKAPPPPPPVDPSASRVVDWRSDEVDDATFSKGWDENTKLRANVRR